MVSEGRICDTVCNLASAGKILPKQLPNGKEPYDGMCDAFNTAFGSEPISLEIWEQAEKNYIKGSTAYISVGHMAEEIQIAHSQMESQKEIKDFRGGLTDDEYWRRYRTARRIFQFTMRMSQERLMQQIPDYLPDEEAAIKVGEKHGLQRNELLIPTEKGGQLLAIRCFMAEYYAAKKLGKPFNYELAVNNNEAEWRKTGTHGN